MPKLTSISEANMNARQRARADRKRVKNTKDIDNAPGLYYLQGTIKTWRYFKTKKKREHFIRVYGIENYKLIN